MSNILIEEKDLPEELSIEQAVVAAYSTEITDVVSKIQKGLPVLIECDKKIVPYVFLEVRNRLRAVNLRCRFLDGREEPQAGMMPQGIMGTMISQLRNAVRGSVEQLVIVLPYLDLLTTSVGGLTNEAREVIPLLYENPSLVWIGFKDPSFPLPEVIENLFSYKINLTGIRRDKVKCLITKREARKFGHEFNPYMLYKYISGMNAVSLRKTLSTLEGQDYPADPRKVYAQLRQCTVGTLEIPNIDLDKDIGGYKKVKEQLKEEILDILGKKDQLDNDDEIKKMEDLLPKGMIFWGPPGGGKMQPLTSKILTPNGWILMGDIKVGDFVIGKDGKSTKVTGVFPQGKKRVFKVKVSDDTEVECGAEHLWEVQTKEESKVISTKEISETLDQNYSIPIVNPIEFDLLTSTKDISDIDLSLPFLRMKIAARINTLQAIMEQKGDIYKDNSLILGSSSKRFAKNFVELVRSLGGVAVLRESLLLNLRSEIEPVFEVIFTLPKNIKPFSDREYVPINNPGKTIVDVIDTGRDEEQQCIMVDSSDHLYVTDGYNLTHNTLFAKAMATALGATITVVSGPELKSKWVGESESNIRQIFYKARQSAPSVIVFDELDSIAVARGTYTGSGVEHSMVNQLLTELDGFHKDELVFVIGTTNFVESLDPALLRPGRFEFHMHIPYPDSDARKEIIKIYDKKMKLSLTEDNIEWLIKRTGRGFFTETGTPFSGDHINAICRLIARARIRKNLSKEISNDEIDTIMKERIEKPKLTKKEVEILATHEAGHAVTSLFCPNAPLIEKITIDSENPWAFGYVMHKDHAHKYIMSKNYLLDSICVALGAREAERILLDDLSLGATQDVYVATSIARELIEVQGMGKISRQFSNQKLERQENLSQDMLKKIDVEIDKILHEQQERAAKIIKDNKRVLETLRDLLIEKRTIDSKSLGEFLKCDLPKKATDIEVEVE